VVLTLTLNLSSTSLILNLGLNLGLNLSLNRSLNLVLNRIPLRRRNVYVTPKSYLSFIKSYTSVYAKEHASVKVLADKINSGLEKLFQAQDDVGKMKVELAASEIVLAEAVKKSAELLKEISVATASAEKVKASAKVIADAANSKADTIGGEKAEVEKDLEAAKPALAEAEDALKVIPNPESQILNPSTSKSPKPGVIPRLKILTPKPWAGDQARRHQEPSRAQEPA